MVHRFNDHMGRMAAAYTFEAGPDPVLLFLDRYTSSTATDADTGLVFMKHEVFDFVL